MVAKRKVFLKNKIVKFYEKIICENADMSSVNNGSFVITECLRFPGSYQEYQG